MTTPLPDEIPHEKQVTPAHVLAYMQDEVMPRLMAVEGIAGQSYQILKAAGILNGKGDELIQIVNEYRQNETRERAWRLVRADIAHRLRWLVTPSGWLKMLGAAIIGGLGWKLVSGLTLPHLPF